MVVSHIYSLMAARDNASVRSGAWSSYPVPVAPFPPIPAPAPGPFKGIGHRESGMVRFVWIGPAPQVRPVVQAPATAGVAELVTREEACRRGAEAKFCNVGADPLKNNPKWAEPFKRKVEGGKVLYDWPGLRDAWDERTKAEAVRKEAKEQPLEALSVPTGKVHRIRG